MPAAPPPGGSRGRTAPRSCRSTRCSPDRLRARLRARVSTPLQEALRSYLDHLTVERGLAPNTLSSARRGRARSPARRAARDVSTPEGVSETDVPAFLVALREGDDEHP